MHLNYFQWTDFELSFHLFFNPIKTELERDAGEDQIKSAYRRLAKFYHPDGLLLAQVKQLCCLKFRMIKFMKFFLS